MEFNELVTDISKWKSIPIRKHDKSEKLIAFGRKDNPESANGWTYVYTVDGIVKYIGNSKKPYLKKRILPELNQKSTIRSISNESGKLGYTNIRLSQLLLNEVYPGNNSLVELKYLDELSWDFIQGGDEIRIGEDRNFCFECNFLLCWYPELLQPIHAGRVSIETSLILRHIRDVKRLPQWNLGLG